MRLTKVFSGLVVAVALLAGCAGGSDTAGAGTYLEPPAVTYPEAPVETVEPGDEGPTIGPLDPEPEAATPALPVRWEPVPDSFANASDLVEAITVGWNLGNTLDAHPGRSASAIRNNSPSGQEGHWGNVLTTEDIILMVRDAGFNAIRIPVTWYAMVDEDLNIREDWMERVQQVVDYAYDNGMIVILNTHHDEHMWSLFDDGLEDSKRVIETMWTQIAQRFADYGDRLIFEGLNEPRTLQSPAEWSGGTPEERRNVNELQQVFVDTVRAQGGHNPERFLIVTSYAASVSPDAVADLVLPHDPAGEGKLIVSLHMYAPYPFALTTTRNAVEEWSVDGEGDSGPDAILDGLDRAYTTFVEHGIPVVIGEMGALNRNNTDSRVAWVTFYVEQARERGMRTFWWDNGQIGINMPGRSTGDNFALFNRRLLQPSSPEVINAIMAAVDATPQ